MKLLISILLTFVATVAIAADCPNPEDPACRYPTAQDCHGPLGDVPNGSGVTAYASAYVLSPATCESEYRYCMNGVLTGSYTEFSCTEYSGVEDFK